MSAQQPAPGVADFPSGSRLPEFIAIKEHGSVALPLSALLVEGQVRIYDEVRDRNYFQIRASGAGFVFQAGGFVGLIPINERLTIEVSPRIPIAALDRLLRLSNAQAEVIRRLTRTYETSDTNSTLVDILADELVDAVEIISSEGKRKSYELRTHAGQPRSGRILINETLRRSARYPASASVVTARHERTTNNVYNAIIKLAIERLIQRLQLIPPKKGVSARLRALAAAWQVVSDADTGKVTREVLENRFSDLPDDSSPSYKRALGVSISLLIDRTPSAQFSSGPLTLASLVFDLSAAFEIYVRAALRARRPADVFDGNTAPPSGSRDKLFRDPGTLQAATVNTTPDIVLKQAGTAWCVIDVKYKLFKSLPDRDDLNQALTYGLGFGIDICMLLYPAADDLKGLVRIGRVGSKSVYCYGIDLACSDMEAEEARMCEAIFALEPKHPA